MIMEIKNFLTQAWQKAGDLATRNSERAERGMEPATIETGYPAISAAFLLVKSPAIYHESGFVPLIALSLVLAAGSALITRGRSSAEIKRFDEKKHKADFARYKSFYEQNAPKA
jgi:hypothetical protein